MNARRLAAHIPTVLLVAAIVLNAAGTMGDVALDMVFIACSAWTAARLLAGSVLSAPLALAAVLLVAAPLVAARLHFPGVHYFPYLVIAPVNLGLSYVFAHGLAGGRVPILIQLVEMMGLKTAEDPAFRRFIARQCLLWSVLTFATAAVALACTVSPATRVALAPALVVLALAQVALFALSHRYAAMRYGRPETWMLTLRTMVRAETWRGLDV